MISFNQNLVQQISDKKSFLIVGLDPNLDSMPINDIFQFNKKIIDSTYDLVVGYKPQFAYYESQGFEGLDALYRQLIILSNYLKKNLS